VPALIVFAFWFGGFLVLTAYARDFMGTKVIGNFTWAWVLALSLILMTWIIVALYLRWADRRLTRLVERVVRAGEES
jgi:uncharacterized membrane protein (DUF485 family)